MAAAQRPAALATLGEPCGPPAWKTIKAWSLVAGSDRTIGTANLHFMSRRMQTTTVEIKDASHAVMMSRPRETANLIPAAATRSQVPAPGRHARRRAL